jgi:hypothetical protein
MSAGQGAHTMLVPSEPVATRHRCLRAVEGPVQTWLARLFGGVPDAKPGTRAQNRGNDGSWLCPCLFQAGHGLCEHRCRLLSWTTNDSFIFVPLASRVPRKDGRTDWLTD